MSQLNQHTDPVQYYDAYSRRYDQIRKNAYHRMISQITRSILLKYAPEKGSVLDLGCGTGINMDWLRETNLELTGLDLSLEMLRFAKQKGHHRVTRASALSFPFKSGIFDLVYSFKVLPHVNPIESTVAEIKRVLKPGGMAMLEFYNPQSLRGLIKLGLRPKLEVAENLTEHQIYTRFDSPGAIDRLMKQDFEAVDSRGIATLLPVAKPYEIPAVYSILSGLEKVVCASPLKYFGGFYISIWRKK